MFNQLWGWIVSAGLVALVVIQRLAGQRDDAEDDAKEAERQQRTAEKQREIEESVSQGINQVRQEAQDKEKANDARDSSSKPSGSFRRD